MTCPHDNISLPTTSDPDTVCADCGAILNQGQIPKSTVDTTGSKVQPVNNQQGAKTMSTAKAKADTYTTIGSVRGCCGHQHRTIEAAQQCINRDHAGCVRQGGYSDRSVVKGDGSELDQDELDWLDHICH